MKNYITPEMEITKFDVEDVIVTSVGDGTGDGAGNDDVQGEIPLF